MNSLIRPVLFLLLLPLQALAAEEGAPATSLFDRPVTPIRLSLPVSGVVQEVLVKVGDRVKKGATLLRLDPRRFQYQLAAAEAALRVAEADFEEAERDLNFQKELLERMVTTENEMRTARLNGVRAEAAVAALIAARDEARLNLELSELKAPKDGVVLERHYHPGEVINSEQQQPPLLIRFGVERE
ncbi:MAG: efflux RND transporter periplasmic adaptor subunit [Gammaproteobacteria bacterium]|jgi:RND family efflux transporter MFP subunit|nr:efflux RND transporter periplasmic adaptor subunit [Gammaproteobacteria bacterium]MBT3489343.1 efflux RND transporter periplasmic adaptor subunit [Gammaproteobacteria bacterium]MBT3718705.1 efflux RND transporter periplasmic adaptor subunit [Gammaproteobacteria bacterium]MBT3844650.1 efflux RND transporter periplasmic adaptor subunit [Gammaproteobacteria bacterium]MBT3893326.1 efflux RND transporter periplasmic adaptor subunit [Gammaproteobacteria bacterium]